MFANFTPFLLFQTYIYVSEKLLYVSIFVYIILMLANWLLQIYKIKRAKSIVLFI